MTHPVDVLARGLDHTAQLLRELIAERPEITAEEALKELQGVRDGLAAAVERSVCRHCGRGILRYPGGGWRHDCEDRDRGCRAASFAYRHGEWDLTLDRRWNAASADSGSTADALP